VSERVGGKIYSKDECNLTWNSQTKESCWNALLLMAYAAPVQADKGYSETASQFFTLLVDYWPGLSDDDRILWKQLAQVLDSFTTRGNFLAFILTSRNEFGGYKDINTVEELDQWYRRKSSVPMPKNYVRLMHGSGSGGDNGHGGVSKEVVGNDRSESDNTAISTTKSFVPSPSPSTHTTTVGKKGKVIFHRVCDGEYKDATHCAFIHPYTSNVRIQFTTLRNVNWYEPKEEEDGQGAYVIYIKVKDTKKSAYATYVAYIPHEPDRIIVDSGSTILDLNEPLPNTCVSRDVRSMMINGRGGNDVGDESGTEVNSVAAGKGYNSSPSPADLPSPSLVESIAIKQTSIVESTNVQHSHKKHDDYSVADHIKNIVRRIKRHKNRYGPRQSRSNFAFFWVVELTVLVGLLCGFLLYNGYAIAKYMIMFFLAVSIVCFIMFICWTRS
jgi:hypothetical protein